MFPQIHNKALEEKTQWPSSAFANKKSISMNSTLARANTSPTKVKKKKSDKLSDENHATLRCFSPSFFRITEKYFQNGETWSVDVFSIFLIISWLILWKTLWEYPVSFPLEKCIKEDGGFKTERATTFDKLSPE